MGRNRRRWCWRCGGFGWTWLVVVSVMVWGGGYEGDVMEVEGIGVAVAEGVEV